MAIALIHAADNVASMQTVRSEIMCLFVGKRTEPTDEANVHFRNHVYNVPFLFSKLSKRLSRRSIHLVPSGRSRCVTFNIKITYNTQHRRAEEIIEKRATTDIEEEIERDEKIEKTTNSDAIETSGTVCEYVCIM